MSTPLEDFIRNNREQFDAGEPDPALWKKLEHQLQPVRKQGKVRAMKLLRISAAAIILVLAGAGLYFLVLPGNKPDALSQQKEQRVDTMLEAINPGYAKEVYHFTKLIETQQHELQQLEKENPELYRQFLGDINKLDSSYNALKNELPANPNREQLLEAMIRNLQLQTELLNQQLSIIKQIKQSNSHEKNSATL